MSEWVRQDVLTFVIWIGLFVGVPTAVAVLVVSRVRGLARDTRSIADAVEQMPSGFGPRSE